MTTKDQQKPKRRMTYTGLGLSLGLVLGGLIGTLIGNPIIFAGGTMILGFAIGAALDNRKK
jgi:hypothetical protein